MDPPVWFTYKGQSSVPRHITHLLVDSSVKEIQDDAFRDFPDLVSVVVPATVRRIGKRAFSGCRNLSNVQLHEGLKRIDDSAFGACTGLENLTIPHGVLSIGNNAFYWCEALIAVSVPWTVRWIGYSAFSRCGSLVQVRLQKGLLQSVGHCAFEYCDKLVDINLPEGLQWIGCRAFGRCTSLCTVTIPSTVTTIGWHAFEECNSLVHVHLNEGLKCIGKCAFNSCTALSAIALPLSLEEIENQAFRNCTNLRGFEIPGDSVVTIPKDCFDCSRSLVNVSIPSPSVDHWCLRLLQGSNACNRYYHLPIHNLCYNSTCTTTEELMEALSSPGMLDDEKWKDCYDMTPFHVVATSSNLRADILECLLGSYPTDILWETDSQGNTMMDYLLKNKSSKAILLMRIVIRKLYMGDTYDWDIQTTEKFDILDGSRVICHDDETRKTLVEDMLGRAGYCYRIEMRSIMEIALWKMKIDELHAESKSAEFIDRASCRYRFGAEDVVKSIVGYLWDGESSTYSTATSTYPKLDFYKCPDFDSDSSDSWPYHSSSDSSSSSEYDSESSDSDDSSYAETRWSYSSSSDSSSSLESGSDNPVSNSVSSKFRRRAAIVRRMITTKFVTRIMVKIPKRKKHRRREPV